MNVLQEILLPSPDIPVSPELFYRKSDDKYAVPTEDGRLLIEAGCSLDFNTYFNGFSCCKWHEYTSVSSIDISLTLSGHAMVSLYHNKIVKRRVHSTLIESIHVTGDDSETYYFKDISLIDSGTISVSIQALDHDVMFHGGCYLSEYAEKTINPVKLAVAFTTYRRESYIEENLHRILNLKNENIHVFIVDNGCTLNLPDSRHYSVFPNRNIGGAGGFARNMLEIRKRGAQEFTHFILMDDDISIDPRILTRTMLFLSYLKDEHKEKILGGAMFRRDLPYYQVESGAKRKGVDITGFGNGLDMRRAYNCLINDLPREEDYNAWWFCCMPVSYLRDDNYPLPVFFQWDDVDYGVRNSKGVILLNGICTWHDAFDSKRTETQIYYATRNPLIVDACHEGRMSLRAYRKRLHHLILYMIFVYEYSHAEITLKGVEDFLKGPDFLKSLDQEEYNREILSYNTPMTFLNDIDYGWYNVCSRIKDVDIIHKAVRILSINGLLLPANRKIILPFYGNRAVQAYRAKEITYYDEITGKGYVRKKDLKQSLRIMCRYHIVSIMLRLRYKKAGRAYLAAYPELTSEGNWKKLLFYKEFDR